jgi:hypothetical protein
MLKVEVETMTAADILELKRHPRLENVQLDSTKIIRPLRQSLTLHEATTEKQKGSELLGAWWSSAGRQLHGHRSRRNRAVQSSSPPLLFFLSSPAMSQPAGGHTFQAAPRAVQGQRKKYRDPNHVEYVGLGVVSFVCVSVCFYCGVTDI